jgi:uncharacterized membrane protein
VAREKAEGLAMEAERAVGEVAEDSEVINKSNKQNMKQKILKICSLVLIIVLMPMFFALADPAATSTTVSIDNPLGQKTILDVVNNALSFLLWISIVVGVFVIM